MGAPQEGGSRSLPCARCTPGPASPPGPSLLSGFYTGMFTAALPINTKTGKQEDILQ